jgi:O-methyltransferase
MPVSLKFETEEYYELSSRMEFFRRAACAQSFNGIGGDYAEFGCWSASTFRLAYVSLRRYRHAARLWAFDSFAGLPAPQGPEDQHRKWKEGSYLYSVEQFVADCNTQQIPQEDYTIVPGFYEDTIGRATPRQSGLPDDICLAYVDCDLYSSTQTVLKFLEPRLKHGMIIALDDYYCWSAQSVSGNRLAMLELAERCANFNFVPYVQFGWQGLSFVVEARHLVAAKGVTQRPLLSH